MRPISYPNLGTLRRSRALRQAQSKKDSGISIFWIGYEDAFSAGPFGWGTRPREIICSSPASEFYTDGGDVANAVNSLSTIVDLSCIQIEGLCGMGM